MGALNTGQALQYIDALYPQYAHMQYVKFQIWSLLPFLSFCPCRIHGADIQDVDASHDNARLASCGLDRKIFITDVATGKIIRKIRAHDHKVIFFCIDKIYWGYSQNDL